MAVMRSARGSGGLQAAQALTGLLPCRGRYIVAQPEDRLRGVLLKLLQDRPDGVRKGDVISAVKEAQLPYTDHGISRALRSLCVAAGAVWHLREGATFSKPI